MKGAVDFSNTYKQVDGSGGFKGKTGATYKDKCYTLNQHGTSIHTAFKFPVVQIRGHLKSMKSDFEMSFAEHVRGMLSYWSFSNDVPEPPTNGPSLKRWIARWRRGRRLDDLFQEALDLYLLGNGMKTMLEYQQSLEKPVAPQKDELLFRTEVKTKDGVMRGPAIFRKPDGSHSMSFYGDGVEIALLIDGEYYCTYGKNKNCDLVVRRVK